MYGAYLRILPDDNIGLRETSLVKLLKNTLPIASNGAESERNILPRFARVMISAGTQTLLGSFKLHKTFGPVKRFLFETKPVWQLS